MKDVFFNSLCFCFFFFCSVFQFNRVSSQNGTERAAVPPRGWNSYNSFSWIISEEEYLKNAEVVANRLKSKGYEYVVVDYLWYRRNVPGAYADSLGFDVIDEWGRMVPDPSRWPSSQGGKGFTEVAKKVHDMGLKFGIHVMRGISTQAVNANTPILDISKGSAYEESGRKWFASDIGDKSRTCGWMKNGFMSVNMDSGASKAFLRSLYQQYADWGVDFVKLDCVFGDDLDLPQISFVSDVLKQLDRPILFSLSPGKTATPAMAKDVSGLVNMYRITGDDWDNWKDLVFHFNITRDFSAANMIGTTGLLGKSWPDSDMLPFGWLTDPAANEGPHRTTNLSVDEQRTQMTLWCMAKSPIMYGGDLRNIDDATFSLITNPTLLEINSFSSNNMEFLKVASTKVSHSQEKIVKWHSRDMVASVSPILGLTKCSDSDAAGWVTESLNRGLQKICWKANPKHKYETPFCVYKRGSQLAIYKEAASGHDEGDVCLDATQQRKRSSEEFRRGSFFPCRRHENQKWELHSNGTLGNQQSGECAIVKQNDAEGIESGVGSWIATGRGGEVYVALFNLNNEKTEISVKISDLAEALPGKGLGQPSCKCREEWSGKEFGVMSGSTIGTPLQTHASALFTINCS
ncbi:alpha-galactosidase-like [Cucurbita moschata]|uniref:Alpha-galactosidase n=1 Tax=Cucurbita moschata TaxID=3662 RepID=A0A6J1HC11_CUCMO|nr:alpha-galactosidase-like [Cucurbita moschata]